MTDTDSATKNRSSSSLRKRLVAVFTVIAAGVAGITAFTTNLNQLYSYLPWAMSAKVEIAQFTHINKSGVVPAEVGPVSYASPVDDVLIFTTPTALSWPCPGDESPILDISFLNTGSGSAVLQSVSVIVEFFTEGGDVGEPTVTPTLGISNRYDIDINHEGPIPLVPPIPIKPDQAARIQMQLQNGTWFNSLTVLNLVFTFANGPSLETDLVAFDCDPL